MATSRKTPYELLGASEDISYPKLRVCYREIIHDYLQNKISADDFRSKVRAYETLSDYDKRKRYDTRKEWIYDLPLSKYTPQQLAAEPALIRTLQDRVRNATLTEINAKDPVTGHTPLYCAARAGNLEAVNFLTEQGAEPDLSQRNKSTALHVASFYGHPDVVRCLLESGADYRIVNEGKKTAEEEAYGDKVKDVFTELKQMPYVRAAANEYDWFVDNTLEQHIDETYYNQRQTLLHCASKKGHFELVRLLVEPFAASLDIVDVNGNSALHLAAYGGHFDIVNYLLTSGCDSTLTNRWGLTAEQEGSKYGDRITNLFQNMREQDMFEKARNGCEWWFQYYFGTTSPDATDSKGTSLLYHACRHGKYDVAKWLLVHGANVNIQLKETPKSTPLQGAKYHGYLAIVELLLEYGADVTIKNDYKLTVFEDGYANDVDQDTANKLNELLLKHRSNMKHHNIMDVHIYLDEYVADEPKTRIQLHYASVYDDLLKALPNSLKNDNIYFSIARRPLSFEKKDTTIISAVCRARYATSKFIDTPLRLTLHQRPPINNKSIRVDPKFDFRTFSKQFQAQSKLTHLTLTPSKNKQIISVRNLAFTFAESSIEDKIQVEIRTLFTVDPDTFGLPECICLFEINLYADTPKLRELPLVAITGESNAYLYTLGTPAPYWFCINTRRTRLPMLDGVHAFLRHVTIFPMILSLPPDMVIATNFKRPLVSRDEPVTCTCLHLEEHDRVNYPEKAYHGTNIAVVQSILADGLVTPGTVVAAGKRVSPPKGHIPRGRAAFGMTDFADAIFLSPSIYYTCDPAYAVPFPYNDQQLLPVLECSVKQNSYETFPSTVKKYCAHPGDNMNAIEWRVSDPRNVVINAVLFIPKVDSIEAVVRERMAKIALGSDDK